MPVGTPSAIVSSTAAHAAYHPATHQATLFQYRNAALLELADRYLGDLRDELITAIGAQSAARRVFISADRQRHAIGRRQIAAQVDADLVATRLSEALVNVRYQLLPQRNPRVFEVVGYVPTADKCLLLALKLVKAADAATKQDEWWVQTAHPFGSRNFRRELGRGHLRELASGALPSNYRMKQTREG